MELVHLYKSMIDTIVTAAGSAALLHVHAGMAIYLGTLVVVRNRRGGIVALQMVFAAEMANEAMDWLAASPRWTWSDTISDIVLTLMWPVAITAVNGLRRRRWRRTIVQDQSRTIPPSARHPASIASA